MSVGCTCIITYAAKAVKRNLFWKAVIFCGEIKKCFSVLVARNEPQATAVELAQLGEGDSPQCGEMSRRDKGAGHPLNRGKLPPAKGGQ